MFDVGDRVEINFPEHMDLHGRRGTVKVPHGTCPTLLLDNGVAVMAYDYHLIRIEEPNMDELANGAYDID